MDPGVSGAIAHFEFSAQGIKLLGVSDMPVFQEKVRGQTRSKFLSAELHDALILYAPDHAVIERVGPAPGQSVTSMFQFGFGAGLLEGILVTAGINPAYIMPKTWQARVGLQGARDNGSASRHLAASLYPNHAALFRRVKDHGRSDAVLIGLAHIWREAQKTIKTVA